MEKEYTRISAKNGIDAIEEEFASLAAALMPEATEIHSGFEIELWDEEPEAAIYMWAEGDPANRRNTVLSIGNSACGIPICRRSRWDFIPNHGRRDAVLPKSGLGVEPIRQMAGVSRVG